jgi:predicted TIM-barrel fold metal-dependent hydrolase
MGKIKFNDIHIHYGKECKLSVKEILKTMDKLGLEKIAIMSWYGENLDDQEDGIEHIANIISECPDRLYGLAWIEPKHNTPIGSLEKIICEKKFSGFKMIPNTWYPYEDRILRYCEKMAELNVPCLFHSGILYSPVPTYSSKYCRPVFYEDMTKINNFKFALAHVSWPWVDECIALFGQWQYSNSHGSTSEMFIDITPGTPPLYRKDAFIKLISFNAEENILFGTDTTLSGSYMEYKGGMKTFKADVGLFKKLSVSENAIKKITSKNFERFFKK